MARTEWHGPGEPANTAKQESKLQAEVIVIARANGWRIDLADLHPKYEDERFARNLAAIAPRGKKLRAFVDFLMSTRQHLFSFVYHPFDSRNSQKGFPDLTMIHPRRGLLLFVELKRDGEYPKLAQRLWYAAIKCVEENSAGIVSIRIWRPKDRPEIVTTLGGIDPYTGRGKAPSRSGTS